MPALTLSDVAVIVNLISNKMGKRIPTYSLYLQMRPNSK